MLKKFAYTLLLAAGLLLPHAGFAQYNTAGSEKAASPAVIAAISSSTASVTAGGISSAISGGFGGGFVDSGANTGTVLASSRDTGRSAGGADKRFGAWLRGGYTHIDNTQSSLLFDGSAYVLVGALDYKPTDNMVIGIGLVYEASDITTSFNNGGTESTGIGFTPFIGFNLNKTWSVDAAFGYNTLEYETNRSGNTIRGSYDAERWYASGNLTGKYASGSWRIMPQVGILYLEEKADGYVESTGGAVDSFTTKLGRISAGGRLGYAGESMMPYVRLMGEYDFEKNPSVPIGGGNFTNVSDFGGQVGAGVEFYGSNTMSGSVETNYLSLGREDLDVWNVTARVRMQF